MKRHDVITVGGGLAGSALAKGLAERGLSVLVLERETEFKDRVRGEQMHPWGVAELKALGLYDELIAAGANELPWFDMFSWPHQMLHRDLSTTTPQQAPEIAFNHPRMQEAFIRAAAKAGAEVRRGVRVTSVQPGTRPCVIVEDADGRSEAIEARLVVGADGRRSMVRQWGGFVTESDPPGRFIAGLLLDNARAPVDTSHVVFNSVLGRVTAIFAQGGGRMRVYLGYPSDDGFRLSGDSDVARFVEECVATGAPAEFFDGAVAAGPLASFEGADTWVTHPYRDGVALVGDAAAANDPTFGEGLSKTVRDVRVLRDCLLASDDWETAGNEYAREHDRAYDIIHTVSRWFTTMFLERGAEADALRMRAFPRIAADPMRVPDHLFSGPDLPLTEEMRMRFFAEDDADPLGAAVVVPGDSVPTPPGS